LTFSQKKFNLCNIYGRNLKCVLGWCKIHKKGEGVECCRPTLAKPEHSNGSQVRLFSCSVIYYFEYLVYWINYTVKSCRKFLRKSSGSWFPALFRKNTDFLLQSSPFYYCSFSVTGFFFVKMPTGSKSTGLDCNRQSVILRHCAGNQLPELFRKILRQLFTVTRDLCVMW